MNPLRRHARVLIAALAGTAVEFYDFYVFATATALVLGPLFFPASSPQAQAISAFMVFGLAFIARPIGAVAFGHFGDRVGRKTTLVASLLLMGASTVLIGFLPAHAAIGFAAPLLLCVLRFGQGFGLGGEWGGAALLTVENAPPGWAARFGAAPQLGAPIGFLFANGLFLVLGLILDDAAFRDWGWRVPFIASAVLVGLGLWVRLRIGETRDFAAARAAAPPPRVPLVRLFAHHTGAVLAGAAGVIACFAIFYLATAFALARATTALGYSREHFLALQLGANCFLALGIVLAAIRADRTSPRAVLAYGAAATIVLGVAFGAGLGSISPTLVFINLSSALFIMGFVYGPLGAWLPTLFPVDVRYTGISVAFNAGGIVGGAVTPLAAQALSAAGHPGAIGAILSVAGALTLLGVSLAKPVAA